MKSIKVAFFSNSIAVGGMEAYLITLARSLREMRLPDEEIDVTIIFPEDTNLDGLVARCADSNLSVVRLTLTGDQPISKRLGNLIKLSTWLRANHIEIFHQHRTGPFHGKWATLSARLAGTPYVIATEHDAPLERPSFIQRRINSVADRLLDKILVVSEENRQRQINTGGRDATKIVRVYPGIDFHNFIPLTEEAKRQIKEHLGIPTKAPLVGVTGRLVKRKGVSTFLRAVAMLRNHFTDIHVLVVGDGEESESLKLESNALGLDPRVIFTGFRTDIAELTGSMDVFVFPSIYEPFGIVAVEAMAMRVPVVASAVGGIPEIIIHEQTGLLVPPEDPAALAQAVTRFLEDSTLAQTCREQALRRSYECFTHIRMTEETYAVYANLRNK